MTMTLKLKKMMMRMVLDGDYDSDGDEEEDASEKSSSSSDDDDDDDEEEIKEKFCIRDNFGNSPVSVNVLAGNDFKGCLPASIGNMSDTLNEVIMMDNGLKSCFPESIGLLKELTVLDLSYNELMRPLPESIGGMKSLEHYSSSQSILLVGEGDYSFSLSLAKAFTTAHNIVATSLDSLKDLGNKYSDGVRNVRELEEMGGLVLCGLDATSMRDHHFLTTQRFDRIVFNFPHAGFHFPEPSGSQIKMNIELVKGFLKNAKGLLKKDVGEIHVTHKDGYPYDRWNLLKIAQKIGLVLHEKIPFHKHKYPGYDNKRGYGKRSNDPFPLGDCTTYKFKLPH